MRRRRPDRDAMKEAKSGTKRTSARRSFRVAHWPVAGMAGLFVSPGYGTHPDRVIDSWELIFVRTGTLHIEEHGVAYRVGPGESILMPPERRHRGLSEHPEDLSFYWIHFTPAAQRLPKAMRLPQHLRVPRPERLAELFHRFVADQTEGALTPLAGGALLLLMLGETTATPRPDGAVGAVALVRKAEEFVSNQLRRGIGPGDVARAVGYNTAYLSRVFRQVHGVTLGGFIHRVQVTQAQTLLRNSADPLKQVAARCGFRDVGYFRRLFRRALGIAPREYRNRFGRVFINRD
jgi:AraC-like DNA-binding protein/mannose-6-phosphate isomerase-like protein (cupin superfamily)